MQNHDQDITKTEVETFKPVSILNGALITDESWCVSYLKQAYISEHSSEHGFMILQSSTTLYKAELAFGADHHIMVSTVQRAYNDAQTLRSASNEILCYHPNTNHTDAEIFHKTCSIPKSSAEELLAYIAYDKKNPPEYSMKSGNDSYVPLAILFTGSLAAIANLTAPFSVPIAIGALFTSRYIVPTYGEKHLYATWAVAKLKDLEIPEITKSLAPKWTDKIADMLSYHLGNENESKEFARVNAPQDQAKVSTLSNVLSYAVCSGVMALAVQSIEYGLLASSADKTLRDVVLITSISACLGAVIGTASQYIYDKYLKTQSNEQSHFRG